MTRPPGTSAASPSAAAAAAATERRGSAWRCTLCHAHLHLHGTRAGRLRRAAAALACLAPPPLGQTHLAAGCSAAPVTRMPASECMQQQVWRGAKRWRAVSGRRRRACGWVGLGQRAAVGTRSTCRARGVSASAGEPGPGALLLPVAKQRRLATLLAPPPSPLPLALHTTQAHAHTPGARLPPASSAHTPVGNSAARSPTPQAPLAAGRGEAGSAQAPRGPRSSSSSEPRL